VSQVSHDNPPDGNWPVADGSRRIRANVSASGRRSGVHRPRSVPIIIWEKRPRNLAARQQEYCRRDPGTAGIGYRPGAA
jgi:hypothetical protein